MRGHRTWLVMGLLALLSSLCGCQFGSLASDEGGRGQLDFLRFELRKAFEFNGGRFADGDDFVKRLAPPKIPWAKMNSQERERLMARVVMPIMSLYFRTNPATGDSYGSSRPFNCLTCHGESSRPSDPDSFSFARPSHLHPLDPKRLPQASPGSKDAKMLHFMEKIVVPATRILLGQPKANCFTCHAVKKP